MNRCGFIDGEYQDGEVRGRVWIVGASNFGKTTEMIRLLDACQGGSLLYDHTGRHKLRGGSFVHTPGELKAALRRVWASRFRLVYQPRSGILDEHFAAVCRIADALGSLTLGVDEIDAYCGAQWGDSRLPPALYQLVHFGRHSGDPRSGRRGVALLYTARILSSVAPALRSQASEIRAFHEHEPTQLKKYIEPIVGSDTAARLPHLKRFEYLVWRSGSGVVKLAGGHR